MAGCPTSAPRAILSCHLHGLLWGGQARFAARTLGIPLWRLGSSCSPSLAQVLHAGDLVCEGYIRPLPDADAPAPAASAAPAAPQAAGVGCCPAAAACTPGSASAVQVAAAAPGAHVHAGPCGAEGAASEACAVGVACAGALKTAATQYSFRADARASPACPAPSLSADPPCAQSPAAQPAADLATTDSDAFYRGVRRAGMQYGPAFRVVLRALADGTAAALR
jgi:hypothetical protein